MLVTLGVAFCGNSFIATNDYLHFIANLAKTAAKEARIDSGPTKQHPLVTPKRLLAQKGVMQVALQSRQSFADSLQFSRDSRSMLVNVGQHMLDRWASVAGKCFT